MKSVHTSGVMDQESKTIFEGIAKNQYSVFQLYHKLVRVRDTIDLHTIRSSLDGYNLLHAIIIYDRLPLILPLIHLKLFMQCLSEPVPAESPSSFRAQTPLKIANGKRSSRFRIALGEHERLYHSMHGFLRACHEGNLERVDHMLSSDSKLIREKDQFGNNCLYWTLVSNNLQLFQLLLGKKAEYTTKDEMNHSLLHMACGLGHHTFFPTLINQCQLDTTAVCSKSDYSIHIRGEDDDTPLDIVYSNGDAESLKELINHNVPLATSSLPKAVTLLGGLFFIKYVLEELDSKQSVNTCNKLGQTAFMKACSIGSVEIAEYLLSKGSRPNLQDFTGQTALHLACWNGHVDVVNMLINGSGTGVVNIDSQDLYKGTDAIISVQGKVNGLKSWFLIEISRVTRHLAIDRTSSSAHVDLTEIGNVISKGYGETEPVDVRQRCRLEHRAKCLSTSTPDFTPLHIAIYQQNSVLSKLLIENGANLDIQDSFGLTPYMMCAMRNDIASAGLLERKGADVSLLDKQGRTAIQIAQLNRQLPIVNYMRGATLSSHVDQYLTKCLTEVSQLLQKDHLDSIRDRGEDVRRHVIDTVRDLNIYNNQLLSNIGSGPVLKASNRN